MGLGTNSGLRIILGVAALVFAALAQIGTARAQLEVDITRGNLDPLRIAVPEFTAAGVGASGFKLKIPEIIQANLARSGLFAPIQRGAFIDQRPPVDKAPRFANWRVLNTQALIVGRITVVGSDTLQADFRLWDVFSGRQLTGQQFRTDISNWRRVAHMISDAVYERLTGEKGYFDTRVVFIAESGTKKQRVKRLAIMDQDGANIRFLTNGASLALTPRFSPSSQMVTYMSYETGTPRVYLLNIETGQKEVVGDFPTMTFAPRFSPDGQRIVMSLQEEGRSDIYELDLRTRQTRRLTFANAIDTAPCYSPKGDRIVFESDRLGGGRKQLFVMNSDGSGVRRISSGPGRYSTPVWSPRGDLIAFTKQLAGRFLIGVMRPDGSGERILTAGFHNEGPTWAPNGRVLMFFRESRDPNSGPKLYTIDLTGYNERVVNTPSYASDPAWSPLVN